MKSFIINTLAATALLFPATSFAGGEDGGAGIIKLLMMSSSATSGCLSTGSLKTSEFGILLVCEDSAPEAIRAASFVNYDGQNVVFKVQSENSEQTFKGSEEELHKMAPEILETLENSSYESDWVEI